MTTAETFTLAYHGKPLRVITRDGEPWFVVADLCRILSVALRAGKPNTYKAMRRLRPSAKDHCLIETSCGPRLIAIVNRDGAFDLASRAKHPNAPELSDFVTSKAMASGHYDTVTA